MNHQKHTSNEGAARITPLLIVDEVAEILRVAPCTIREWCRECAIPHVRLSNQLRFEQAAIAEFIQCNRDELNYDQADDDSRNSQAAGSE